MALYKRIDYSNPRHWLSLPDSNDKEADVFYLYPTAWIKNNPSEPDICELDNPSLLEGAAITYKAQASAFETSCNIYTPYYRQASVEVFLKPINDIAQILLNVPIPDAVSAFNYYIKNYNNGRPFILAGHSQGSAILLYILVNYMKENPEVYKNMAAAYIIGCPVTEKLFLKYPHLKFAEGYDDTGVIISYNTEAPDVKGRNITLLPGAKAINPLSWTQEETIASERDNLGSLLINEKWEILKTGVKNYADARVDKKRGVVVCSTVNAELLDFGNPLFPRGVYHSFDYPFYYNNLRENAAERIRSYLMKQKPGLFNRVIYKLQ